MQTCILEPRPGVPDTVPYAKKKHAKKKHTYKDLGLAFRTQSHMRDSGWNIVYEELECAAKHALFFFPEGHRVRVRTSGKNHVRTHIFSLHGIYFFLTFLAWKEPYKDTYKDIYEDMYKDTCKDMCKDTCKHTCKDAYKDT